MKVLEVRHEKVYVEGMHRIIVISDIHSHLDRFKQLLQKVNYQNSDYLIVLGDFVEKGDQALETVSFLQYLQSKSNRVYVILGNCEYALEELVCNPKYDKEMLHYLNKIGKSGMIRQALNQLNIDVGVEKSEFIQNKVKNFLEPYFNYFRTLPTTLELNNFIFVHAGIENRMDWHNSSTSSLIEMKTFYQNGHCLDKYVVVGHLPTSNQHHNSINNGIIIDHQKKVISIDGGTGVKAISQLNALIIEENADKYSLSTEYVQPLPLYQAIVDVKNDKQEVNKVAWPNFEVEILEYGKYFSVCRQCNTNKIFKIKNEFLYKKKHNWYCLDDYVDNMLSMCSGDIVKLIGIYGPYAYVIKDNEVGWVKYSYLKKIY